ncbi:MAG: hypothetical protein RIS80_1007 [Actinomycetota bacterium]
MAKSSETESKAAKSKVAPKKSESKADASPKDQATITYVLDTSVLLSDPKALFRFKEQNVVIPIIVINELEKKRIQRSAISLARRFDTSTTFVSSTSVSTFRSRLATAAPCASN